jgi:hypothetical protein
MMERTKFRRRGPSTRMRVVALDGSGKLGTLIARSVFKGKWLILWDGRRVTTAHHWTEFGPAQQRDRGRRLFVGSDPKCEGKT